jgi:hypothetical protein
MPGADPHTTNSPHSLATPKQTPRSNRTPTQAKARLDAYLAAAMPDASRAKLAASIKAGRVTVNGAACAKPSAALRAGDRVEGSLLPPEPCTVRHEAGRVAALRLAPSLVCAEWPEFVCLSRVLSAA